MPKLDLKTIDEKRGASYPDPFAKDGEGRYTQRVGAAGGLTQFGATRVRLTPGAWSSQRHWHECNDEFIVVLEGEVTMVTDAGEEIMRPGDMASFPAGEENAHTFINRTDTDVVLVAVGTNMDDDVVRYPDIDLVTKREDGGYVFYNKNDEPYSTS